MELEARTVFVGADLFDWLKREAKEQHRTVDAQAEYILAKYRRRVTSGVPVINKGSVVALQRCG